MFGFAPFATLPFSAVPEAGPPPPSGSVIVYPAGVEGLGQTSSLSFRIAAQVTLVGVQAVGRVTRPLLWTPINPDQDGGWQNPPIPVTSIWVEIDCDEDANWHEIQT